MNLYFFDDEHIAHKSNMARVSGPVTKLGAILESGGYQYDPFAGTILPLPGGGWRAYMNAFKKHADITTTIGSGVVVCESPDGINWHEVPLNFYSDPAITCGRIRMDNIPPDFSGRFLQPQVVPIEGGLRMYAWFHGLKGNFPIVRYIAADSTDGYSFAIRDFDSPAVYHPCELGRWGSEAGLVPTNFASAERPVLPMEEMLRIKSLRSNDATYVYYSKERKEYVMYTVFLLPNPEGNPRRENRDNAPGILRSICMRTSRDGLTFSAPRLILVPDECDPLDQQFYHMAVHKQDGWHIGFLGDYKVIDQAMDIQLAFSRDGICWQRPMRTPFFERGGEGSFDSYSMYASGSLVDAGDDWIIMYRAGTDPHNHKGEYTFGAGLARFGKRRFMGLNARGTAFMLTKPFILTKPQITVDANIQGTMRAELCDAFGTPLPGYRREDFVPVSGDSREHPLAWRNKTTQEYIYDAVSVRFEITDGTLYTLDV